MENIKEINLTELFAAVVRKIWLVILCAVVLGALTYVYTENFVTPMYQSSVSIYVNNKANTTNASGVSASDLATSQRLVATYVEFLRSNTVIEKVSDNIFQKTGKRLSANTIRGAMTAQPVGDTELFQVFISAPDPEMAALVANAIADVAPGEIAYFVEGSSTKIVDYAKIATAPYTPNKLRNTTMGMLGGAVIAIIVILLQTLLDVRVKGEEDLAQISGAPVLGMIPDLMMETDEGGQYGYRSGYHSGYKAYGYRAKPQQEKKEEA